MQLNIAYITFQVVEDRLLGEVNLVRNISKKSLLHLDGTYGIQYNFDNRNAVVL